MQSRPPRLRPRAHLTLISTLILTTAMSLLLHDSTRADWPTWRGSASRGAVADGQLAATLNLQWSRRLPPPTPAWSEDERLYFDACHEPIVVGGRLIVASSVTDSVTAYELDSGQLVWRFFADGPVRLAPAAHRDRIYFGADDGYFYCLSVDGGTLNWKFRAAPTDRRAIGNGRLTSVWPVRGGSVIVDDRLYFAIGVWPFEETMLYSVDLSSGDGHSVPDHTASPLPDVSPQGYLAVSGNRLFIPAGRANVHCIDLAGGGPIALKYNARATTDYHVTASGKWMFHGGKIVDVEKGETSSLTATRPVSDQGRIYFADKGMLQAYDLNRPTKIRREDRRGEPVEIEVPTRLWRLNGQPVTAAHLKSGDRVYAHHESTVIAVDLPEEGGRPEVSWKQALDGTPATMAAADGKLIVTTSQGTIYCFGDELVTTPPAHVAESSSAPNDETWNARVDEWLAAAGTKEGYCLVLGIGSGKLVEHLLARSRLHVVALDPDERKVNDLRRRLHSSGLYGQRAEAHVGDVARFRLPPYLADVITSEDPAAAGIADDRFAERAYGALRPYGGKIVLELDDDAEQRLRRSVDAARLAGAKPSRQGRWFALSREGALPGSADWTHEYGDPANTLVSRDKLVKAPLGVLWFGGNTSDGELFYDRHDWGPSLAVIEGRMFLQGPQKLTAVDIYTGRMLWQVPLPDGNSPGRRANWVATGFHFVALADALYLALPDRCVRLDPRTGETVTEFALPEKEDQWGRIRIWKELMIVPVFREVEGRQRRPVKLLAMDRHSGKILWTKQNDQSFPMVAIGGGKLFCVEGLLEGLYVGDSKERKNGDPQSVISPSVTAYDVETGEPIWSRTTGRVPSWLAYSEQHDVVVTSNKTGIDAWGGKDGDEIWKKEAVGNGFRGHPENYYGRVILWKDRVIDQRGPGKAYDLKTGEPIVTAHPLTGDPVPWEFTKIGHHCNYAIASEHLLTFRAASAGFLDLESGGTGRLEGFRSGCRNSLIPAGGVLNAPNMASGCVCGYSIFTSLALVHQPESNLWTYGEYPEVDGAIRRIGVNFGADGDRRDERGTMWLDYPERGGPSPQVDLKVEVENPVWLRSHASRSRSDSDSGSPAWVTASGVRGIKSISVPVVLGKGEPRDGGKYTVRLHFAALDKSSPGDHVFDVRVQGKDALTGFDVVERAGGIQRGVVQEISAVSASDRIQIEFSATKGQPSVCGIEVIAERVIEN